MIILGIDPGEHAGWGKYINGEYDSSDAVNGDCPFHARDILIAEGPDVMVIEDQFNGRMRWKSLQTLLRRRYLWQIAAELQGIRVVAVRPSDWQGFYRLRRGKNAPKMVEQYSPLASAIVGHEVYGDRAVGCLLAYWGVMNL